MNNKIPALRVGMTAVEALAEILKHDDLVKSLALYVYKPHRNSHLLLSDTVKEIIELSPAELNTEKLEEIMAGFPEKDTVIGVSSRVIVTTKRDCHIPMIRFGCARSASNLNKIESFLKKIKRPGVIVDSGGPYHFYGFGLFVGEDWYKNFLSRCNSSKLVDASYITQCLRQGYSLLRLTGLKDCPSRSEMPTVASIV